MQRFTYPVNLMPEPGDDGFVVTFPDVPEAITQGDSLEDALANAADALEETIAARIRLKEELPRPSRPAKGGPTVCLPLQMAGKAALYSAIRDSGLTNTDVAAIVGCDEKEIRRLIDPRHPSKLPRIERVLRALGRQLVLGCVPVR